MRKYVVRFTESGHECEIWEMQRCGLTGRDFRNILDNLRWILDMFGCRHANASVWTDYPHDGGTWLFSVTFEEDYHGIRALTVHRPAGADVLRICGK